MTELQNAKRMLVWTRETVLEAAKARGKGSVRHEYALERVAFWKKEVARLEKIETE